MDYVRGTSFERFIKKVDIKSIDECWNWTASIQNKQNKYGCLGVKINGKWKIVRAHRFSFEHFIGTIPKGMMVIHDCDNQKCVNPNHLSIGDDSDNMQDMWNKKRHQKPKSKLTIKSIGKMRALRKSGIKDIDIAKKFGLSRSYVRGLLNGNKKIIC